MELRWVWFYKIIGLQYGTSIEKILLLLKVVQQNINIK